jgi:predicted dehydrogenase
VVPTVLAATQVSHQQRHNPLFTAIIREDSSPRLGKCDPFSSHNNAWHDEYSTREKSRRWRQKGIEGKTALEAKWH